MNQTTVNTINGMYIIPTEKQAAFLAWLQQNAVKAGAQPSVYENTQSRESSMVRQLISENVGG